MKLGVTTPIAYLKPFRGLVSRLLAQALKSFRLTYRFLDASKAGVNEHMVNTEVNLRRFSKAGVNEHMVNTEVNLRRFSEANFPASWNLCNACLILLRFLEAAAPVRSDRLQLTGPNL